MKYILLTFLFVGGFSAVAEEKTCTVKGPHCKGCAEMIEGKVCDETKYSTCEVTILDENKKIGQVRLVTKDTTGKVDEKELGKLISETDKKYKLEKCKASKKTATEAPKA